MFKMLFSLLILLTSQPAQSKINGLSLEIKRMLFLRHAYYPEKSDWRGFVGLNWNISNKNDWLYWDNQSAFYGDNSQVRHIFWQYEVGFRYETVDVFYYHKSEHTADANREDIGHPSKFPLEDSFGIRINFK